MKRRKFIAQSSLSSIGVLLGSELLAQQLKSDSQLESDFSGMVLIIGAGAAGLYAGFILKQRGIDFTIIEASNRYGGRLGKKIGFADYPLDRGAQWMHGRRSIVGDLVKSTKTKVKRDRTKAVYWFEGELTKRIPEKVEKIVRPDQELSDLTFAEYAQQAGLGKEYKHIVEQIAGDYGSDSSDISIKWTAKEEEDWSSKNGDFKFEETYFDLIDKHIATVIKDHIIFNSPVAKIDYRGDAVLISTQNGKAFEADKVIVTVPITILKDGDITFIPELPKAKTDAFKKIGMGAGMKVFLKFKSKFYDKDIMGGEVCAAYSDESTGKTGGDHVLMAFVMGKQAERLTALGSDEAITAALLAELDLMYDGQAKANFVKSHIEDYSRYPYIRGAYSYSTVGIGTSRSIAAASVASKLFFAGEAMNLNGHHQTVHGAMESGYREVVNVMKG